MSAETRAASVPPGPATPVTPWRGFYWTVRREIWENRSVYIAPLAVALLVLFGLVLSAVHYVERLRAAQGMDADRQRAVLENPFDGIGVMLIATGLLVAVFYCLDALYGERRDRSILFWKSLPVSDLAAVLAKASVPLLVIPAIVFVITLAAQFVMLLLSSVILPANGLGAGLVWTDIPWGQMTVILLYGIAILSIWFAPLYAWLLLVSGWATRAPLLWAVLPPLAIAVAEKIAFGTWHFGGMLGYFLSSSLHQAFSVEHMAQLDSIEYLEPVKFFSTPSVWVGLLVAAIFLFAASLMRRYRGPI